MGWVASHAGTFDGTTDDETTTRAAPVSDACVIASVSTVTTRLPSVVRRFRISASFGGGGAAELATSTTASPTIVVLTDVGGPAPVALIAATARPYLTPVTR